MRVSKKDFESLYQQYGPMVMRRCRYLLNDEEKARDAFQDTFLRLLEKRTDLSGVCSSLFYTVATRVCINKIRSDKYRTALQIDTLTTAIEDNVSMLQEEIIDVSHLLDYIFQRRDTKDREIAIYHYVDGFTLEETAEKMKMSVSGVRKRLSNLKIYVEKLNIGE